jgi:hypothetical protein
MKTPGFTAEASLPHSNTPHFNIVTRATTRPDMGVYPAQAIITRRGAPILTLPPIDCQPGLVPVLVQTGGGWGCLEATQEFCINKGTPWETCYPATCTKWGFLPFKFHWECRLLS